MRSRAGRRSPAITTTSPLRGLLLFASRKRGRKRQRGHPNNAQVGTFVRSYDHGFTSYYNDARLLAHDSSCHMFAVCIPTSEEIHSLCGERSRWATTASDENAFFCKYETDVNVNRNCQFLKFRYQNPVKTPRKQKIRI